MIIARISGGLGNQMFQYAIGKSIALKNQDKLKLDTTFYAKNTHIKYELNLLNVDEVVASEYECKKMRGAEGIVFRFFKKFNLLWRRPLAYKMEIESTLFDSDVYNSKGDIYLDGFWQNEKYFSHIKEQIKTDFLPKVEISHHAKKYLPELDSCASVSLHVRRGDYVSDPHTNKVHGVCSLEYYKKAIEYIFENVENPMFYIFSDDISWCQENFSFLKDKVFISDTESAIDDLMLMKHCKHNIIANSSFSWWGAWLNSNHNKVVVAPEIWWNAKRHLNPSPLSWKKI